jgi:hypothetical protein
MKAYVAFNFTQELQDYNLRNKKQTVQVHDWKLRIYGLANRYVESILQSHATTQCYDYFDYQKSKYFLLLLNKKDNWRIDWYSPYYSDMSLIIKNISLSLPFPYSLVVKDHPHSKAGNGKFRDANVIQACTQSQNTYYVDPARNTFEFVENATAVFSIASTSGFDALMLLKHVILFGESSYNFGSYDAPIHRVTNMERLPEIVKYCISNQPDCNAILAYLYSFFEVTASRTGLLEQDDWTTYSVDLDLDVYLQKVGLFLKQYVDQMLDQRKKQVIQLGR